MTDHGGNIYSTDTDIKYDFSVNLNPLGPIPEAVSAAANSLHNISYYPDPSCSDLKKILVSKLISSHSLGVDTLTCDMITLGSGAAELILSLCHALLRSEKSRRKGFLLPAPGFSEYERGVAAAGGEIYFYNTIPSLQHDTLPLSDDICAVFVCNPNNPTGQFADGKELTALIDLCLRRRIFVVMDECFLTLSDTSGCFSRSMIGRLHDYSNLVILRSFTKTFAIPGLRLGYLISGCDALNNCIKDFLPCWNVSIPAQAAGAAALRNCEAYLKEASGLITDERSFLQNELKKDEYASLIRKVYPSDTCFILFECSADIYGALTKKGILIRDCRSFRNLNPFTFRIAVKTHEENLALLDALRSIVI